MAKIITIKGMWYTTESDLRNFEAEEKELHINTHQIVHLSKINYEKQDYVRIAIQRYNSIATKTSLDVLMNMINN